ncbi:WXG100 family type VII secretion target [Streptomyces sp. NRRL S-340]|uniref:WXG100 family type VII secretion target n=1 Tax=Streptomyces sp. NRRL S-340 TaxID=1463901 RepID=UPI00131CBED4|nr:WXG100 family type VII secretion target [Streptomyces sp. NRRL S-340]
MGIDANFPAVQSVVQQMEEQAAIMNRTIDNLQEHLAGYTRSWIGEDKAAYDDVNRTWERCQRNAKALLDRHTTTLNNNMVTLARASASNRDGFQSITI